MNNPQDDIAAHRARIDEIDTEIVRLVNERAKTALEIGEIKAATGQKVYDPAREGDVIEKVDTLNHGPLSKGAMEEIFRTLIDACRQIQVNN